MIIYSVDRFEGNIVVLENKTENKMENILKEYLPNDVKEGDIVIFENGNYYIDYKKTKEEQEKVKNMVDKLFNRK